MDKKSTFLTVIKDGILKNNPVFVQFLGMCSVLAITTSVTNAIGMGLSVTAVLICSNLFISLLRNVIPKQVRIASYVLIIAGFVTAVELIVKAYLPALDKSLGLFIPLIVVNCIILARAEAFASKNPPLLSALDGLACGIGYTLSVIAVAFVREILGTGKLLAAADGTGGLTVLGDWYPHATLFIMPAGAFLTLGFLCAAFNKCRTAAAARNEKKHAPAQAEQSEEAEPIPQTEPEREEAETA